MVHLPEIRGFRRVIIMDNLKIRSSIQARTLSGKKKKSNLHSTLFSQALMAALHAILSKSALDAGPVQEMDSKMPLVKIHECKETADPI